MDAREARYREAERRLWGSLGVSVKEQRVRLGHVGATVRVQELGSGPPVLFVHGGSTCGTSWADLVARLDGFRCLLLDRPVEARRGDAIYRLRKGLRRHRVPVAAAAAATLSIALRWGNRR